MVRRFCTTCCARAALLSVGSAAGSIRMRALCLYRLIRPTGWCVAQALQPLAQAGETLGMSHFLSALDGRRRISQNEHSFLEQMQMQKGSTGEWVSLFMLATNMSRQSVPADSVAQILTKTGADVNRQQDEDQGDGMPTVFIEACYLNRLHLAELMLQHGADANARTPKGNWVATIPFKHHNTITTQFAKDLLLRIAASERGDVPDPNEWMRNLKTLPRVSEWAEQSPTFTALVAAAGEGRGRVGSQQIGRAVEELYKPFVQALLRRCNELSISDVDAGCNLNDRVDSGSGWFQMNFVKGTLMHAFAASGHRDLAELWVQAGGSSAVTDLVGATPATIAARNGYFNFPGAVEAAKAEGLTTEPYGFVQRRELRVPSHITTVPMGNGGWSNVEADLTHIAVEMLIDLERCDIDEVSTSILPEEFLQKYALASRPLAIRGGCSDWQWSKHWKKESFLDRHGDEVFEVSDVPYKDNFYGKLHGRGQNLTLAEFYTEHLGGNDTSPPAQPPQYVFSSNPGNREAVGRAFLKDIPATPPFLDLQPTTTPAQGERGRYSALHIQFFLGPTWSGAPPHYHSHAWNGLAYGRKLWLLWPPSLSFYSKRPILDFLRHDLPQLEPSERPLTVVQEAGDVVFVPSGWAHGILNLKEGLGLAEEFDLVRW